MEWSPSQNFFKKWIGNQIGSLLNCYFIQKTWIVYTWSNINTCIVPCIIQVNPCQLLRLWSMMIQQVNWRINCLASPHLKLGYFKQYIINFSRYDFGGKNKNGQTRQLNQCSFKVIRRRRPSSDLWITWNNNSIGNSIMLISLTARILLIIP